MPLRKYLFGKIAWCIATLVVLIILNFVLPRLVPGNPVDAIVAKLSQNGAQSDQLRAVHAHYVKEFGLNQSLLTQFWDYVDNLFHGNLGVSFALYPAKVSKLIGQALPWTIALQLPAILIGWIVGNILGAIVAFKGGIFDKSAFFGSLFLSTMPYYCLAILLLYLLAVAYPIFPATGGYDYGTSPELTISFVANAINHYWLPFLSLVMVFIGGQAVGMRSMAIYELGSDYVNYSRGLGLPDRRIVRYIFRNAMLPQITGLALSVGTLVGGALITEIVFSYPGIGTLLFDSISQNDYPAIQAITLIIAVAVILANFLVDVTYGFIDPRIRAAQSGER